jgi:hypothetical protein
MYVCVECVENLGQEKPVKNPELSRFEEPRIN